MPLLMGGGDPDMSIEGIDAESGDNDGMGMVDEVGGDTGDDILDELHNQFDGLDDEVIDALEDEDLADIQTVKAIINIGRRKRRVKFYLKKTDWERHLREIQETNEWANGNTCFDERFCMRLHHFDHLHDAIKE
jgi:hypothetical protein